MNLNIENIKQKIKKDLDQSYLDKRTRAPRASLYVSKLAEPCERYHYYSLLHPGENWPLATLKRFEEGNIHESAIIRKLREIGYKVIAQESYVDIPIKDDSGKKLKSIRGKIDGAIEIAHHQIVPVEIKAYSSHLCRVLNTAEDFKTNKYGKYAFAQVQLYLYSKGFEVGLIVLKDKNSGDIKFIDIHLDYDYVDRLLNRAKRVYVAHFAEDEEKVYRHPEWEKCQSCPFLGVCDPQFNFEDEGIEFLIGENEIDPLIDRKNELEAQIKPLKAELKKVKKKIEGKGDEPGLLTNYGKDEIATKKYIVKRKKVERKGYTVKPSSYFTWKYTPIEEEGDE